MAQAKGRRDGPASSNENARRPLSSGGVEGVAWRGPRTLLLQKNSQGFGFTLRHFIVYPPESSLQPGLKDEENGNRAGTGCQRSRLEPMDTIFVKSVRDRGPAHQAGLSTGDRLVKVNGESVLGKTYSQVIALIQNSENVLELSIMPKDEDVLQLAFSQDAYLRGNEPYTGVAQSLPEPPPLCYPRPKPAPPPSGRAPLDNRPCRRGPPPLLDNRLGAAAPTPGWPGGPGGHRPEDAEEDDAGGHLVPAGPSRARSSSAVGALDFHFANHNAAIASATLPRRPPPRKGSLPASASATSRARPDADAASSACHRALSDWYYSQAEAAERMSPRHRSVSQDGLTELGLGLALGPPPDHRRETLLLHTQAASSHDSHWLGGGATRSSCSEGLLAAYADYERSYGRSVETLAQAAALVSPRYERTQTPAAHPPPPSSSSSPSSQPPNAEHEHQRLGNQQKAAKTVAALTAPPAGRQTQQQVAEPQTRRREEEEEPAGYRSYSPSFCRKAGRLLQQAHSFRDASYSGPRLRWSPADEAGPSDGEGGGGGGGGGVTDPRSAPALPSSSSSADDDKAPGPVSEAASPTPGLEEAAVVVLRQKPPSGRRTPVHAIRHPGYGAGAADSPEPPALPPYSPRAGTPSPPVSGGPGSGEGLRKANGSLAPPPHTHDSLSSIPFIDEPTSPSADLRARHVPACSVVSSGARRPSVPAPALLASSNAPPTLSSSSDSPPPVRLRTRDCSSVKGRRSSYLLAITTERSKSCDEGLNTFRDEGRVFSRLPKRVKSFFTDGSLESLRAAEEARSKRHSTSELGTITFSDVRKEGWLHYKQILTEKGKKVGGGMRPWKRVFSVLRCHSLFLYKDKREAVLHGAGAGPGHATSQDEHPPISIRGSLIDIAYSETKRKHTLRLTTQDFCEYLLQTEDRDDMLAWIRVIRENGKTDSEELGFSRQALINKKLNDYRKQSPTGNKPDTSPRTHRMMPFLLAKTDNASMNRSSKTDESKAPWGINIMKKAKKAGSPKAFGARLEDCQPALNNKFVPLIVEMCCGLVESMGLDYTGIYRVPGNNALVSNLQEQLNKGMEINVTEERWQDLNVISSLLKSFFRKLPEPLFTDDKYNDFIDANRLEDAEDRLKTMKKLIHDLPDHYHHTLKFLVGHLKTVADNSDKNKMEPRNLALVFGPTLVRTSDDNMTDMVTHMPDRYKIIETLILHYDWFFSDGDLDKDGKTPVDNKDMQPVPNIDHLLSNIGRAGMPGDISDSTTSDSIKSKASWDAKRDLNARDFLPLSIINAVTRKRKKCPSVRLVGSSTDEDSEHEPIKSSNYGVGGGEKGQGEEEEAIGGGGGTDPPRPEKREGTEGGKENRKKEVKQSFVRGAGLEEEEGRGKGGRASWENRGRMESGLSTKPAPQPRPNSFLYSHYHPPAAGAATTQPSPPEAPPAVSPLPKLPSLAKARSIFPSWLSPSSRPPSPSRAPGLQQTCQQAQQLPLRCRKTRAGRARAVSMNLELEAGGGAVEDGARGRREGERLEARRSAAAAVCVGVPQGLVVGPAPVRESSRLALDPTPPRLVLEPALLASSSSGWTDQGSSSSAAALRRTTLGARDKRKAWRRHTVVV